MSIFKDLSKSLEQATAFFEGKENGTRVTKIEFTKPEVFTAARIKEARKTAGLTQKQMAMLFDVSIETIKSWERGINHPNGPSSRLLQLLEARVDIVENFIKTS